MAPMPNPSEAIPSLRRLTPSLPSLRGTMLKRSHHRLRTSMTTFGPRSRHCVDHSDYTEDEE